MCCSQGDVIVLEEAVRCLPPPSSLCSGMTVILTPPLSLLAGLLRSGARSAFLGFIYKSANAHNNVLMLTPLCILRD